MTAPAPRRRDSWIVGVEKLLAADKQKLAAYRKATGAREAQLAKEIKLLRALTGELPGTKYGGSPPSTGTGTGTGTGTESGTGTTTTPSGQFVGTIPGAPVTFGGGDFTGGGTGGLGATNGAGGSPTRASHPAPGRTASRPPLARRQPRKRLPRTCPGLAPLTLRGCSARSHSTSACSPRCSRRPDPHPRRPVECSGPRSNPLQGARPHPRSGTRSSRSSDRGFRSGGARPLRLWRYCPLDRQVHWPYGFTAVENS